MPEICEEEFNLDLQKWQEYALDEPVIITEKDEPKLYLLSKAVFDSLRPLSDPTKGSRALLPYVIEIDVAEFNRVPKEWQERALDESIGITEKGTAKLYLISRPVFKSIYKGSREACYAWELSAEEKKAIAESEMSPEHDYLDALLEED